MNMLYIILCIYFVVLSFVELVADSGNFEYFHNTTNRVNTGYITGYSTNQAHAQLNYSREQLLDIGNIVSNNKRLSRLDNGAFNRIKQFNIARGNRGKRGGKPKIRYRPNGVNFNNLVYPKTCNSLNRFHEKVSCLMLNCRSLVKKDTIVGQTLRDENIDFALLTETWFSDEKQYQFETCDLNQNGFKISVANRSNRIGGGIALTCRSNINTRRLSFGTKRSFEFGLWQLIFKNITLHVLGVYRPPSLATPTQFVSDFFQYLEEVLPKYSNIMIMGDFNLHLHKDDTTISDFKDSLEALGLQQHVNFGTYLNGNCLDLVITEVVNGVEVLSCEPGAFISDHCAVKVTTNVPKEKITSKTIKFRNFVDADNTLLANDLSKLTVNSDDIDMAVGQFENDIENIIDIHAPFQEKTKILRAPKPWFTEDIVHRKRVLRKAERLWRKHQKPHLFQDFKEARNAYIYAVNNEKRSCLSQTVLDCKGNSKKLYKFVSELTGTRAENPMPQCNSDSDLAEQFADFFMNKIDKIRDSLQAFDNYKPTVRKVTSFDNFKLLSEDEIKQLIHNLKTTSCELDVLPTNILKSFVNELLPQITKLVNLSLQQGVFPTKWKQAIVRPLLKKVGLELEVSNYRPVSNLTFLSKLIEKAALLRLNTHVNDYELLPKNQSANRQYHSCESALLRLTNDLLNAMEHQEVTALIAMDLSAAFDTVDHDVLVDVLKCQYGLGSTAIAWVDSYLRPRSCRVNINKSMSSCRDLKCSVPQGSCLGPWLYLTYAGTLFDVIPPSITVYGFADDHTANKRFRPTSPTEERKAITDLETCAKTINTWMNRNKLKMNTSKTEFIMFGSVAQLSKCKTKNIDIAGDIVDSQDVIRYLGAFLDNSLNYKEHVKRKCKTAMVNYFRIKSIRKYLTKEATETLMLSLVISHLDYCNVILYGIAKTELDKLQRVQNMCAKLVLNRSKYDSSKQALFDLHWLPIKARISFKILTFMYNCSTGKAPAYLKELLIEKPLKRSLRSSSDAKGCYTVPFNKRKTFGDRSFSTAGPRLWNELPSSIKLSTDIDSFKKNLKTLYFKNFFSHF